MSAVTQPGESLREVGELVIRKIGVGCRQEERLLSAQPLRAQQSRQPLSGRPGADGAVGAGAHAVALSNSGRFYFLSDATYSLFQ